MRKLLQIGLILCLLATLIPASMPLNPAPVQAQTPHENETITTNAMWLASDSPHIVTGRVQVNSGVTLTIEPGCEVRFNSGAYISAYGTLNAPGTSDNGVTFTKNDTAGWSGLYFYSGSSGDLDYCTIEYATYGVYANSPSVIDLNHCTLQNNSYGFWGDNIAPALTNNTFQNNTTGIYIQDSTSPEVPSGNTVGDNTTGIYFYNCTSPSIATPVSGGTTGIHFRKCTSPSIASGNTIQNNTSC